MAGIYTGERITQFLEDYDQELAGTDRIPLNYEQASAIIDIYETALDERMINRPHDKEEIKRHEAFAKAISEIYYDCYGFSPVEMSIFHQQSVALHYLLVSNQLEVLYQEQLTKKFGEKKSNLTKAQEIDIKAAIVEDYLDNITAKNEETIMQSDPHMVSVGMEWEYYDPAVHTAYKQTEQSRGFKPKEGMENLNTLFEQPSLPGMIEGFSGINDTFDPQAHLYQIREVVTLPEFSFKTQLRKLLFLRKEGLEGTISTHETFVGLHISPTHTEVMDVRAIINAAGLAGPPVDLDDYEEHDSTDSGTHGELYLKTSLVETAEGTKTYYFPYFRTRTSDKINSIRDNDADYGVEFRSFPGLEDTEEGFGRYVRKVTYEYYACCVIKAVQKEEALRDEKETALNDIWNNHLSAWNLLLKKYGLQNIPDEKRYAELEDDTSFEALEEAAAKNEYSIFLEEIDVLSAHNPEFKEEVTALVRNFNRDVKRVLGLVS